MQEDERDTGWRKAISETRDRLQSRALVGVVAILLALEVVSILRKIVLLQNSERAVELAALGKMVAISAAFAVLVLGLRATTRAGALFGGVICLILLNATTSPRYSLVRSGLTPLALLFVLTFLSTRAGRQIKVKTGLAEKRRGRNSAQVIANLSTAALSVSYLGFAVVIRGRICCGGNYYTRWVYPAMMVMCLAALVEATADTVSSEIGQAFGGVPVLLVGWQRVAAGTDGAVTLVGSGAGIFAGAMVAVVGAWALRLNIVDGVVALLGGVCGLFFDSLLGAVVERRGWMGNDLVNFASTVFAAGVALGLLWWI